MPRRLSARPNRRPLRGSPRSWPRSRTPSPPSSPRRRRSSRGPYGQSRRTRPTEHDGRVGGLLIGRNTHERSPHTTKARRLSGGPSLFTAWHRSATRLGPLVGSVDVRTDDPRTVRRLRSADEGIPQQDQLWRIEVRDDHWVYVFHRSTPMGRYRSLREAAEWLVDQGVSELVECRLP